MMMIVDKSTVTRVTSEHVSHSTPKAMLPTLLLGVRFAVRFALLIIAIVFATIPGCAQNLSSQPSEDQVWRCSLDGKFYTITNWNGVHIRAVNSGQMMAEIAPLTDKKGRIKTDKKGNNKLEGQWGSSAYGGLIVIQDVEPNTIRGFVLAPTPGILAASCKSRTAAVLLSMGQPAPICNVLNVSWEIQPGVSAAQAGEVETLQSAQQQGSTGFAQQTSYSSGSDQQLVGTWFKERFDGYARYTTTLVLRGDGTYTKSLIGRDHSGTWTSAGMRVHLSGDGNYPPTDEDMSLFRRVN